MYCTQPQSCTPSSPQPVHQYRYRIAHYRCTESYHRTGHVCRASYLSTVQVYRASYHSTGRVYRTSYLSTVKVYSTVISHLLMMLLQDGDDEVLGIVEGRPEQLGHGGVHHGVGSAPPLLSQGRIFFHNFDIFLRVCQFIVRFEKLVTDLFRVNNCPYILIAKDWKSLYIRLHVCV